MSYEFWTTFASIGTFVVIGATAVAAIIQLRHLRASNQLEGLLTVLARVEDPNFNAWVDGARVQLAANMADPDYRRHILEGTFDRRNNDWLNLANSYEWVGSLVASGLIPEDAFMRIYYYRVTQAWELLADVTALIRRRGGPSIWENFEYLAVRADQWQRRHPQGVYPSGVPRMPLHDRWSDADLAAVSAGSPPPA